MKNATKALGPKEADGVLRIAEEQLQHLAQLTAILSERERIMAEEVERVRAMHAGLVENFREAVKNREQALMDYMKEHKDVLFDHTDQVDLRSGILLRGQEDRVKIPRTAVAELEKLGWEDGLKRTVAADREAIGKWPVERLAAIGAEKRSVESYSYELRVTSKDS